LPVQRDFALAHAALTRRGALTTQTTPAIIFDTANRNATTVSPGLAKVAASHRHNLSSHTAVFASIFQPGMSEGGAFLAETPIASTRAPGCGPACWRAGRLQPAYPSQATEQDDGTTEFIVALRQPAIRQQQPGYGSRNCRC
jgi:hypothetical protein